MKIEVDQDIVRPLMEEINMKFFLLEVEESKQKRQLILDYLLEDEESPMKQLSKILGVNL